MTGRTKADVLAKLRAKDAQQMNGPQFVAHVYDVISDLLADECIFEARAYSEPPVYASRASASRSWCRTHRCWGDEH